MDTQTTRPEGEDPATDRVVVRRSGLGWQVGPEESGENVAAEH